MKWKVCGLRDEENILKVSELKPDFMGFIFYGQSDRNVLPQSLITILPKIDKTIKKVGVFVNEDVDTVMKIARSLKLDHVQLHGEESTAYVATIAASGLSVIKVFHIDADFDWTLVEPYAEKASYFLFDTKGAKYGGNGFVFNWELLANYTLNVPYFLSGGLDLLSVKSVFRRRLPNLMSIDVNSRFEVRAGIKNIEQLTKLKNQLSK